MTKAYEMKTTPLSVWVRAALDAPDQQWLIEDLIPAQAFTLVSGRPKVAFKSFLVQLIALAVATGKQAGPLKPVGPPQPVVYVDLEGVEKSTAQRYMALAKGAGLELPDNLHLAFNVPFSMGHPACVAELRDVVRQTGAKLVVIDTLAKATSGMDENSSRDMGTALLCAATLKSDGVACIVVHHLAKAARLQPGEHMDPDSGLRGSSSLSGAYDAVLAIQQATVEGERNLYIVRGGKYAPFEAATIEWDMTNQPGTRVLDVARVSIGEFGDLPQQDEAQSTSKKAKF